MSAEPIATTPRPVLGDPHGRSPRIRWPAFLRLRPHLELDLSHSPGRSLAIRHGDGQWPELDAVNLSAEELFPVCSPSLLNDRGGLLEPENVLPWADAPKDVGPFLRLGDQAKDAET